jgi:DNA polymerase-3 subunit epsilon
MLLRLARPLLFIDLETTGLEVDTSRIVEIGLVRLHPDGARTALGLRCDPGVDIPEAASRVHGIRTTDVRGLFGRPKLGRLADRLLPLFEDADLAGFNVLQFDIPLWIKECARHGIPFDPAGRHVVDAKVIFNVRETAWDRFLMGPRSLAAALRHFCGRDLDGAHAAEVDAAATVDVLLAQLERYTDLPRDVAGLHDYCVRARQSVPQAALSDL